MKKPQTALTESFVKGIEDEQLEKIAQAFSLILDTYEAQLQKVPSNLRRDADTVFSVYCARKFGSPK